MGNEPSVDNTPKQKSLSIELDAKPVPSSHNINKNANKSVVNIDAQQQQKQSPYLSASKHTYQPSESINSRLSSRLNTPIPLQSVSTPDSGLSSFPSTPILEPKHKRNNSFSYICNGITGSHIHSKIIKIAATFWNQNISNLQMNKKLEIACSIFFGSICESKEMKDILSDSNKKIDKMSLMFLDMIGWLLRYLVKNDIDLYSILSKLGVFHQKLGVKINHFASMLKAMHETLTYYYPKTYTIEVKYAMDEIFSLSAQIMTGEDLKYSPLLNDITKSFEKENNIEFLTNLDVCLQSKTGKEYLYRYLQQHFCDEMVMFFQLLAKFKSQTTATEMFVVAKDIIKTSIEPNAYFTINISYECSNNVLAAMQSLESKYITKEPLNITGGFFGEVEYEIYRLILQNHWTKFVYNIKMLHSKSFGL